MTPALNPVPNDTAAQATEAPIPSKVSESTGPVAGTAPSVAEASGQAGTTSPEVATKRLGMTLVGLILLLVVLVAARSFLPAQFSQGVLPAVTPEPTVTPQATSMPVDEQSAIEDTTQEEDWVLYQTVGDQKQVIARFTKYVSYQPVLLWQDWLIWGENGSDADGVAHIQVKALNAQTGEKVTVYKLDDHLADFKDGGPKSDRPTNLGEVKVIDNTLYFSVGGYLTPSGTYWMPLPPQAGAQPKLLSKEGGNNLTQWSGYWWLINGFGDGCGGGATYRLVDLKTHTTKEITSSDMGCVDGDELVAVDAKRSRVLMAEHVTDEASDSMDVIYTSLGAKALDNPNTRVELISQAQMPANVSYIEHRAASDQVILHSPGQDYAFNLATNALEKVADTPVPEWSPRDDNFDDRSVAEQIEALKLPPGFELVLE